jgi:hypothetical protein
VLLVYKSQVGTEIKRNAKFEAFKVGDTWHVSLGNAAGAVP